MAKGPSKADLEKASKKTLKVGSKGKEVEVLQQQLISEGSKLTADGLFGPGTKEAVKKFQKSNKLDADGIVGPNTWGALKHEKPAPEPEPEEEDRPTGRGSRPQSRGSVRPRSR